MTALITDHKWRPPAHLATSSVRDPKLCEYMNCRRPVDEHERAKSGRANPHGGDR